MKLTLDDSLKSEISWYAFSALSQILEFASQIVQANIHLGQVPTGARPYVLAAVHDKYQRQIRNF